MPSSTGDVIHLSDDATSDSTHALSYEQCATSLTLVQTVVQSLEDTEIVSQRRDDLVHAARVRRAAQEHLLPQHRPAALARGDDERPVVPLYNDARIVSASSDDGPFSYGGLVTEGDEGYHPSALLIILLENNGGIVNRITGEESMFNFA
ncbi:hypothetical protein MY1884_007641 [Beauveria asiatica]